MTEETENSFLSVAATNVKNVLILFAGFSALMSITAFIFKDTLEDIATIPNDLARLEATTEQIRRQLNSDSELRILDILGNGLITSEGPFTQGESVPLFYMLRRNISCDTMVTPIFYDVSINLSIQGNPFPAQKAPVTTGYNPFRIGLTIPNDLPDGEYIYIPLIKPIDCGEYDEIRIPSSTLFTVQSN